MNANVTGLCQKCFHPCEHYICTECGASEYFPEAECGVEDCVRSLYNSHPECYCSFQPRCREHAYWECARCSPKRTQFKFAVACGEVVSGKFDEVQKYTMAFYGKYTLYSSLDVEVAYWAWILRRM